VTVPTGRRGFLYATTAAVGAVGLAAAAWPFIDHLNPDAGVRATGDVLGLDLASLAPGERRVVRWRHLPVFLVKRTAGMLEAMQAPQFVGRLADAGSAKRQQPPYAVNWHRSIDPALAVLVGVCTYCACVPQYVTDAFPPDLPGGYACPCCASHFDPAGRAHAGPAQYNLPVPPYETPEPSRIVIGRNRSDALFRFESIERI
jgi:ubiquinol-cytochrome c reductase iron-sulfur subunit